MEIDFDADKDSINRFKHQLSFIFGKRIFDDPTHIVIASFRPVDGEDRYKAIGLVDGKYYTVVYVRRDGRLRFISVRRSNSGEQGNYHSDPGGSE